MSEETADPSSCGRVGDSSLPTARERERLLAPSFGGEDQGEGIYGQQRPLDAGIEATMKRELLAVTLVAAATMGVARAQTANNLAGLSIGTTLASATNNPSEPAQPPAPLPKIQFDKTVYDFGTTSFVDSVTGTFTYQNVGTGVLKVVKPRQTEPDVLKPGEKGELVFTLRVASQRGELEKHIIVSSNDPQSPSVTLTVRVDVKQILEVTPGSLLVGDLKQGATTNLIVTLRRIDGEKLVVANVQPGSKMLTARIEPVEGNDQSAKVLIDVQPTGAPRCFIDNVKVFLDGISRPAATIYVNGQLLGDVLLDHEQLYWPVTASSNAAPQSEGRLMRRITVTSTRHDQPLEIRNLASSLKDLNVELVTVETGKTYSVVAKFASLPGESERGTISFETNTSIQPKITIPVTIVVLKQSP